MPIPIHFNSLIPKMLMFTLAFSCLTMSNLPWFMDLTFQVPMHCCSLQRQTLLSPADTSIAEFCFHFSSASFFLELLVFALHSSPVPYWTPSNLGAHLLAFSYCSWVSHHKNTGLVWHSLLQYYSTIRLITIEIFLKGIRNIFLCWLQKCLTASSGN